MHEGAMQFSAQPVRAEHFHPSDSCIAKLVSCNELINCELPLQNLVLSSKYTSHKNRTGAKSGPGGPWLVIIGPLQL